MKISRAQAFVDEWINKPNIDVDSMVEALQTLLDSEFEKGYDQACYEFDIPSFD